MKRLSIGTLSIGILCLFSCTQEEVTRTSTATGEAVSMRLNIAVADMQPGITIAPATRAAGNGKHNALSVGYHLPDAATRSDAARTDAEKALKSLWMLQFDGTATGSTLIKKTDITALVQDNAAEVTLLANDTKNRVYLVANADVSTFAENSTTLQHFEEGVVTFAPCTETELAAGGLPMIATADIDPRTDNPGTLMLQSMVTKLTLQCNVATGFDCNIQSVVLNQVSEKAPVTPQVAGDAATRAPGITDNDFVKTLDITPAQRDGIVTCYFPENLAGRKSALTEMWERTTDNAPTEKAASLEIVGTTPDGKSVIYTYYLGDGTPQDFNVAGNRHYKLALTLQSADETDLRVENYIDLNPGGKTANCYLVPNEAGVWYDFDATVMGNGATTEAATQGGTAGGARIVPQTLSPKSAKVLWETGSVAGAIVSKVELSSGKTKVLFETGAAAGNAVIAVYDNADPDDPAAKILWSWHIWKPETEVTDFQYQKYVDNTGVVKTADNYRMMDRNLGAATAITGSSDALGLLYQWGRKDPFPGAKNKDPNDNEYIATTPALASGDRLSSVRTISFLANNTACLAYGIEHPTTFFTGNNDWLKVKQDNLWGNPWEGGRGVYTNSSVTVNQGVGGKSIYDPCPVGYRVPPQDTWTALNRADGSSDYRMWVNGDFGWSSPWLSSTGSTTFLPGSGDAYYTDGKLIESGKYGYLWTSSPNNGTREKASSCWYGYDIGVYVVSGESRTLGCSVRCVSELVSEQPEEGLRMTDYRKQ